MPNITEVSDLFHWFFYSFSFRFLLYRKYFCRILNISNPSTAMTIFGYGFCVIFHSCKHMYGSIHLTLNFSWKTPILLVLFLLIREFDNLSAVKLIIVDFFCVFGQQNYKFNNLFFTSFISHLVTIIKSCDR